MKIFPIPDYFVTLVIAILGFVRMAGGEKNILHAALHLFSTTSANK